jgi:ribosome biogenesis GTPase
VGLWAQTAGLELAFSELQLLAEGCRFRDCSHSSEPGCQVTAAIAAGTVSKDRLASWLRLQQEQLAVAARPAHPPVPRKLKQRRPESMRPHGRR